MGISLRPEHLKRYAQIARLLLKYGRSDLVRQSGLQSALDDDPELQPSGEGPRPEELAADLEAMGPTFTKLGQLLSTRVDLIPVPYAEALSRLQDAVEPFPFEEVERIIQEEIGVRISKAFLELEPTPVAAASLGQVHRGRLRDGRPIAIKVQRPDIRPLILEDFDALEEIADTLDAHSETAQRYDLPAMLSEMRATLLHELDYRREASHLSTLKENLQEFERIIVPAPVDDFTTSRVLTMEYVHGRKITEVSPLARLEMDGEVLADQLFEAYLKQILVDGFFHADPHPGNVFLTDDHRLALIDVGMVGRIATDLQEQLLRLLLAISDGRAEEASRILIELGERRPGFDERSFSREIGELVVRNYQASAQQLQIGRVMIEVTRSAGENWLLLPAQLTTLGKALMNLDQVGRTLDPSFEPNAAIRRHSGELMQRRMRKNATPASAFSTLLEMNDFVQRLPGRLNRVLDAVTDRELEVQIRVLNEDLMMEGLQKIANRIAMGVVLAALIVGASMLMRVETTFRILGYPGLGMLFFLAAAIGGVLMVINILAHDRRTRRKP